MWIVIVAGILAVGAFAAQLVCIYVASRNGHTPALDTTFNAVSAIGVGGGIVTVASGLYFLAGGV